MDAFVGAVALAVLSALGVLAYRHPESYRKFGRPILYVVGVQVIYLFGWFTGANSALERAKTGAPITDTTPYVYGHHPAFLLGLAISLFLYLAVLNHLDSLLKLPKKGGE